MNKSLATILSTALACLCATNALAEDQAQAEQADAALAQTFDRTVAPILAANCLSCHSGDKPKGKLDLSSRAAAMRGAADGPVIVAGKLAESFLWDEIELDNMPPKHPLSDEDKKVIRDWIEAGAHWGSDPIDPFAYSSDRRAGKDWWSLQPLVDQPVPAIAGDTWSRNDIDRFILARLKNEGLAPSPQADPRTLVRRLYIDVVGLPAPVEVIDAFAKDPSPQAWAKLVDELLASEHYGERWARHWLDVARFGESSGYEYNSPRESAWHYRDWVIRSLNDDLPYDAFVRMQLAGDILKPDTVEGAAAVGFLVAGVHNAVQGNNANMKMAGRQDELEEISGTVGQAFLGMTVHCARCHDHKFDPIPAQEYYQFIAALDGVQHGTRKIKPQAQSPANDRQAEAAIRELKQQRADLHRQLADLIVSRGGQLSTTANIVTTQQLIEANQAGQTYRVALKLASTVWAGKSQATASGDGVIVRLITADNTVVHSHFFESQDWDNAKNAGDYQPVNMTYQGDGSGPVRVQLQPYPLDAGRFGGAVDELVLSQGQVVVFEDNFDQLQQPQPHGMQADTQRRVYHSATSTRWQHSGINTIHAEQHADGNFALQLYGGRSDRGALNPSTPQERQLKQALAEIDQKINRSGSQAATELYTVRAGQPGVMRVHERGSVETLGQAVAAGGLGAIRGLSADFEIANNASDADRRIKLGAWITSPDNPLFHRVAVNRIWHHHFGQGIVDTPNDFGFNGGRPSHPMLLDYLAVSFRDSGYSLKQLHRLILTSATYQQASRPSTNPTAAKAGEIDQGNRLLWRHSPRRIEAEAFRDSVLAIAGALNTQMYGPGYKDVRIDQVPPAHYYVAIDPVGPPFNRRTIYRWMPRGQRSALLDTFDCPDPSVTTPKRSVTTTPSQALSQWNHSFVLRMSTQLAERVEHEAGDDVNAQVKQIWRLALGRSPEQNEAAQAQELVAKHGLDVLARVLFNTNEFIWID